VAGVASELESCIAMAHDVKLSFGLQLSVISGQLKTRACRIRIKLIPDP